MVLPVPRPLTVDELKAGVTKVVAEVARRGDELDTTRQVHIVCLHILYHFMGDEWVRANLIDKEESSPDYFRANAESQERYKYFHRVLIFAEMLFNLQHIEGFATRLPALRKGGVEDGVIELQSIGLLYAAGFNIRLRKEGYDLDVVLPNKEVAVEVKCKLESTSLSRGTILDTLNHARGQLPRDRAGVILVNIPEAWVRDGELPSIVNSALGEFFGNTGRVSMVVFWWEMFVKGSSGWWRMFRGREEYNPAARIDSSPVKELHKLTQTACVPWVYLDNLVKDMLGRGDEGLIRLR